MIYLQLIYSKLKNWVVPIFNFVKKHWKLVLILSLIAVLLYVIKDDIERRKLHEELQKQSKFTDTVEHYKDKIGNDVGVIYEKLKGEAYEDTHKIDSLKELLKIKDKTIKNYLEVTSSAHYLDTIVKIDSIRQDSSYFAYKNPWISFQGVHYDSSVIIKNLITKDTIQSFLTSSTIKGTTFNKWVLRNSNPYSQVEGMKDISYSIETRYSPISLGLSVGYDPFRNQPTISVGLHYDIIRFKKKK